jgi:hypothetical protein
MEALNEGESTSRGTGIIISTLLAIDLFKIKRRRKR